MANMDFCDKHNMVAFLQKPTGSEEFHQIVDFLAGSHIRYALTTNPTIYVSLIEHFWQTATVKTINDEEQQIIAIVDGQTITIIEASVRRHLQLADVDGISSLPNTKIFEQLTLIGYVSNDDKLTFQKGGDTPGSDEGSKKLNELTKLCTKLFDKVTCLEKDLKQTKKVYGKALTKLVKKVKHLEDKLKSTIERRKASMVILDDEEDLVLEDPFKQGRRTETEYEEVEYKLDQTDTLQQITPTKVSQGEEQSQESSEVQLDVLSATKILADASRERVKTYKSYTRRRRRSTASLRDSTAGGLFSTVEEILSTDERIAQKLNEEEMAKALDKREDTDDIDWNAIAEQVQERESDTIKRYQTLKKKPVSVAQARKNMMIYLKNIVGYKMNYFKGMSYDEIRPIFEEEYNNIQTFFKKLRAAEASRSEPIQEQKTEESQELSKEELQKLLVTVPVKEIYVEALQVKYLIINWEVYTEESRVYWKIIRVRDHIEAYQTFENMLKKFDRDDLEKLWKLVKERFNTIVPTNDKEKELWVELKRLFELDDSDILWKLQRYMHNPLNWKLYDSCGVHHVSIERGHDIFMLVEKDYPLTKALTTVMLSNKLQVEESLKMSNELLRKIFYEVNKPRS
ncbi:hypothetical protein Tco_1518083 [Tanacetum coccineum]